MAPLTLTLEFWFAQTLIEFAGNNVSVGFGFTTNVNTALPVQVPLDPKTE